MDASIFYSVTPEIKVGLQSVNLLNEVTKTIQLYTNDGREAPRSYFMNAFRVLNPAEAKVMGAQRFGQCRFGYFDAAPVALTR